MDISNDIEDQFSRRGVAKFAGLIPPTIGLAVRQLVEAALEQEGVYRDQQWVTDKVKTSKDSDGLQAKLQKKLKQVTRDAIRELNCDAVLECAGQLAGTELSNQVEHPQLLFTPPNADHWFIPNKVWHVDMPRLGESVCPGVQMFTFLNKVEAGAGGTVVAGGSHHYLNDQGLLPSKKVKQGLKAAHPWFKGLFSSRGAETNEYLDQITMDGSRELQVIELTGQPGDVYLMDLRVLHSLAPNIHDYPRLMVTQRYYSRDAAKKLFGES